MTSSISCFSAVLAVFSAALLIAFGGSWVVLMALGGSGVFDTRLADFYRRAPELEAVSLGHSHSVGLHFPTMGLRGHSLYGGFMDIRSSHLKLRVLLDYTPSLDFVFLPISPGTLSFEMVVMEDRDAALVDGWLANMPLPRSGANISLRELASYSNATITTSLNLLTRANRMIEQMFLRIVHSFIAGSSDDFDDCLRKENDVTLPDEFGIMNGYWRHATPAYCMDSHVRKTIQDHWNYLSRNQKSVIQVRSLNIHRVREMTSMIQDRNGFLILVVVPITREYFETEFAQVFWISEIQEWMKLVSEEEMLVLWDYHDFFFDDDYMSNNLLFSDDDHLTLHGARIFSRELRRRIDNVRQVNDH